MSNLVGKSILHYKIVEYVGQGGMGVVYKAQDTKLDRFVALKFLPPLLDQDERNKDRFVHEAKAASALDHSNICTVYQIDETEDGQMFIAMAYHEGKSLKEIVETQTLLPLTDVLNYGIQIADGLQSAHEKEIVHRDIKPANIIITERGEVKIVDFGLAKLAGRTKLTREGTTLGTVEYMSPEQAQGGQVDQRTDIWALGVVIYEMVTGRAPFTGDYEQAIFYSIINQNPMPLSALRTDVPMELERIVDKCLEKNKGERYQSLQEVLVDLRKLQDSSGRVVAKSSYPAGSAKKKNRIVYLSFVALILMVAVYVLYETIGTQKTSDDLNSIAVLPFVDMSPEKDQEYFCDGIAEELISAFTKIPELRVAARTSAFQFKEKNEDIRTIGDQLNVNTILEGSVRKAANTIRITAQLVNVNDGYHLWSQTYERKLEDIFDIQEDISQAIVNSLKLELEIGPNTSIIHQYTDDIEAYNFYLQGRYYWNKRSKEDLLKAIDYFEVAIEADPDYALAYTGLADAYSVLGDWVFLPPREAYPKARSAATKALKMDSTLAEAQASIAYITYIYDWDWTEAERLFKRALRFNPKYASAHQWYAEFLATQSRFEEAHAHIRQAEKLDPLSPIIKAVQAEFYFFEGRYELAEAQYLKALKIEPDFYPAHYFLRWIYERTGSYQKAFESWDEFMRLEGASQQELKDMRQAFEQSDIRGVYRSWLAKLKRDSKIKYVSPINFVAAYNALGEHDVAFEWLEKLYEERSNMNAYLNVWPPLDNLRSDPRFQDLLKRVGLNK